MPSKDLNRKVWNVDHIGDMKDRILVRPVPKEIYKKIIERIQKKERSIICKYPDRPCNIIYQPLR